MPIANLHVNATKFQGGPRLSYEQWHALPDDAKKIWDMLSPKAKSIILCPFLANKPTKLPYFGTKKTPPQQHQAPPPCQAIHKHEFDYLTLCLHELHGGDPPSETFYDSVPEPPDGVTSVHEDISEPDSQPLLAHVTKKKPLPPGNVKRLLSPAANSKPKQGSSKHPQEVHVNRIIYTRQIITVSVTYNISST